MGFLDVLLGRTKPKRPDLDRLFDVPNAALTLEVNGWAITGSGSVCYRAAEGAAFAETQADVSQLLNFDNTGSGKSGPQVQHSKDSYGFTWLTVQQDPSVPNAASELVTDLHAVNSALQDNGFGPMLLCSLVTFTGPENARLALIYLYKQGTFYPFVPRRGAGQQRDNITELNVRSLIANDLPIEGDLSRWLAVWGAPGL
jgi:hypothetical protein